MHDNRSNTSHHGQAPRIEPWILDNARDLRTRETMPERLLWNCLRGRKIAGLKFRRQHSRDRDIYDFYCDEARLVVELDGRSHEGKLEDDRERDALATSQGLTVLRFRNKEVTDLLERVLMAIEKAGLAGRDRFSAKPSPGPSGHPLPGGEGYQKKDLQ